MNCLVFISILLFIIGNVFGRIVNFNLLTFGNQVTVTYNDKTLEMKRVDNYSNIFSISGLCPDDEFEYVYICK